MKTLKEFFNESGIYFAAGYDTKNLFPTKKQEFDCWDDKHNCPDSYIADVIDEDACFKQFETDDICIANIAHFIYSSGDWYYVKTSDFISKGFDAPEPNDYNLKNFKIRFIGLLR